MSFGIPVRNGLSISLLSTTSLSSGRGLRPSLALNFLSGTLDSRIDFTRTSAATYVDATGKIVSTPASRNLLTFTQEFDNAAWSKSNSTITANSTAAPDGTMTADTLVEDAATATHLMSQTQTLSATPYTASVYLKAKERGFALFSQGTVNGISVNLSTGAVASAVGSPTNIASTNAGNGWWRVSFTFTPSAGSTSLNVYASTDGVWANRSYAGSTSSGIFVWGTQLELGSTLTTYTRNNGGVYPPRFDYDPVTLAPNGLLVEEQRTNLLLRSAEFDNAAWSKINGSITANATTSPDGTVDADRFVPNTTGGVQHRIDQTPVSSAVAQVFSVFVKASGYTWISLRVGTVGRAFDIANGIVGTAGTMTGTITSFGNGWYRCAIAVPSPLANDVCRVNVENGDSVASVFAGNGTSGIYLWGAQLEAGAFATSYIPTVASQVTRTADVATITGANFSQWFNAAEGCFVVGADVAAVNFTTQQNLLSLYTSGTNLMRFWLWEGSPTNARWTVTNSTTQADLASGTLTANTPFKAAAVYSLNDFAVSYNGAPALTDTSGTVPVGFTQLNIGSQTGLFGFMNGHIRSIQYYNTRLPNAQLQALTS